MLLTYLNYASWTYTIVTYYPFHGVRLIGFEWPFVYMYPGVAPLCIPIIESIGPVGMAVQCVKVAY